MSPKAQSLIIQAIAWVAIAAVFAVAFAAILAASHVCHRWVGPLVTGTTDPVAVAVYCKGGR